MRLLNRKNISKLLKIMRKIINMDWDARNLNKNKWKCL
jgi:hypothetical protein